MDNATQCGASDLVLFKALAREIKAGLWSKEKGISLREIEKLCDYVLSLKTALGVDVLIEALEKSILLIETTRGDYPEGRAAIKLAKEKNWID